MPVVPYTIVLFLAVMIARGADVTLEEFHKACREGNWAEVKTILPKWQDLEQKPRGGRTALQWAVSAPRNAQRLKIVRALLERGADANAISGNGESVLLCALSSAWDEALLEALFEAGALPWGPLPAEQHALLSVARRGDIKALKILLSRRAPIKIDATPLFSAALREIMKSPDVVYGAARGSVRQRTVLCEAVRLLLSAGADPLIRDRDGFNGYFYAARTNVREVIGEIFSRLSGSPGDVLAPVNGRTILHEALAAGTFFDRSAFESLVRLAGCPIDSQDGNGYTPLHEAVRRGRSEAVVTLLLLGADAHIRDAKGLLPIQMGGADDLSDGARAMLENYTEKMPDRRDPAPVPSLNPVARASCVPHRS